MKPTTISYVLILAFTFGAGPTPGQPSTPARTPSPGDGLPDSGSRRPPDFGIGRPGAGSAYPAGGALGAELVRQLDLATPRTALRTVYDVVRQHREVVFVETFDGHLVPYQATGEGDYERLKRNVDGRWKPDGLQVEISSDSIIDIPCPECEAAPGASSTGNVPVVKMKSGGVTGKTWKKGGGSKGGSSSGGSSAGSGSTGDSSTDGSSICCCRSQTGTYLALDRSRCHQSCTSDSKCPGIGELRQAEALEAEIRELKAQRKKKEQ